jgi:hypothetical protein
MKANTAVALALMAPAILAAPTTSVLETRTVGFHDSNLKSGLLGGLSGYLKGLLAEKTGKGGIGAVGGFASGGG